MDSEAKRAALLDDLLGTQAATIIADQEADELDRACADAESYDNPALDQKLRRMIRRREKRDRLRAALLWARRPAAAAVVILLVTYSVIMSVEALRVPFLNPFIREEATHTEYGAAYTTDDLRDAGFLYAPAYVPDGYDLVGVEDGNPKTAIYTNSQGECIFLEQSDREFGSAQDAETEQQVIVLHGEDAYLITGKGQTVLFWEQGGVFLKIICSLEAAETIQIAESMTVL